MFIFARHAGCVCVEVGFIEPTEDEAAEKGCSSQQQLNNMKDV